MNNFKNGLKKLKSVALENALVSFYVIKRKMVKRSATYTGYHVNIDKKLQDRLCNAAVRKVRGSNDVREYDFSTTDLDDDVLGIETLETDMHGIIASITSGNGIKQAGKVEDLYDAWMYIVRLDLNNIPSLYYARQISGAWNMKNVHPFSNLIWKNQILMDVSEDKLFKIDTKIDFFSFEGILFIADKKNFEKALNFRVGMENNRDQIIAEFQKQSIVDAPEKLTTLVGNNIQRLRKLSQVKNAGYYKNPEYLKYLRKVNEKRNWGLVYTKTGQIVITEENIEEVLRLLNNDRLISEINGEIFDVDAKHKL